MKALFVALFILVSACRVDASPSRQITDSCLKTQTISTLDLSPRSFYVEEDLDRKIVSSLSTIASDPSAFGKPPNQSDSD